MFASPKNLMTNNPKQICKRHQNNRYQYSMEKTENVKNCSPSHFNQKSSSNVLDNKTNPLLSSTKNHNNNDIYTERFGSAKLIKDLPKALHPQQSDFSSKSNERMKINFVKKPSQKSKIFHYNANIKGTKFVHITDNNSTYKLSSHLSTMRTNSKDPNSINSINIKRNDKSKKSLSTISNKNNNENNLLFSSKLSKLNIKKKGKELFILVDDEKSREEEKRYNDNNNIINCTSNNNINISNNINSTNNNNNIISDNISPNKDENKNKKYKNKSMLNKNKKYQNTFIAPNHKRVNTFINNTPCFSHLKKQSKECLKINEIKVNQKKNNLRNSYEGPSNYIAYSKNLIKNSSVSQRNLKYKKGQTEENNNFHKTKNDSEHLNNKASSVLTNSSNYYSYLYNNNSNINNSTNTNITSTSKNNNNNNIITYSVNNLINYFTKDDIINNKLLTNSEYKNNKNDSNAKPFSLQSMIYQFELIKKRASMILEKYDILVNLKIKLRQGKN